MDSTNIYKFLNLVGCRNVKIASRVVRATCPFEYLHSGGVDKHPSFAVKIVEGDESTWKCFTCNRGGLLERMIEFMNKDRVLPKKRMNDLYGFIIKHDRVNLARLIREVGEVRHHTQKNVSSANSDIYASPEVAALQKASLPVLPTFPEGTLEEYFDDPVGEGLKYLKSRKVSDKTIVEWELKWHANQRRVMTPIRDLDGNLVGLPGRSVVKKAKRKYLHSTGFKRDYYLYGENKVVPGNTGYLVEGQFDVIALWQYGYRYPVGAFGSTLTPNQADKVVKIFSDVVIVGDPDAAGQKAAEQYARAIDGRIPHSFIYLPEDVDPGKLMEKFTLADVIEIFGPPQVG
jgi:hypothetical protein